MTPNPFTKQYLMTAGPTPVPPAVSQAMAAPMLYHRAPAFVELYQRVLEKLPKVIETSTGIVHDVQAIAEVTKRHGAILVVDAVSGLGAAELRQDAWGIDVVVAGSQKALMCPPGLGFVSVSERALEYANRRPGG